MSNKLTIIINLCLRTSVTILVYKLRLKHIKTQQITNVSASNYHGKWNFLLKF